MRGEWEGGRVRELTAGWGGGVALVCRGDWEKLVSLQGPMGLGNPGKEGGEG